MVNGIRERYFIVVRNLGLSRRKDEDDEEQDEQIFGHKKSGLTIMLRYMFYG
jgi:hypothetical protein